MTENDDLPWSCEAEQSVLGSLLLDNDALSRVHSVIDASSFWHAPHRPVFSTIARMVQAGQPADVITVFEALRDAGQADEAGGLAYLNALTQSVASAANVRRYAEIVADKALRRAILVAADSVADLVHDAETADAALDRAQTALAALKRSKGRAAPTPLGDLFSARLSHWQALAEGDAAPGIPTGLAPLDEALGGGLKPGRVIVLAARPSVGKTSLAAQLLLNTGEQGHPALMLSQEMTAGELIDRTAAHLGRIHLDRLSTGHLQDGEWSQVAELADSVAARPVFIDDQPALSLLDIRAKARQVQRQAGGLALVVVDYVQLCSSAGNAEKRHHQIEQISRGIKAMAKELGVCVLLLSQLNRSGADTEPELQHLKESGSIEEDADVVVLLHPMGNEPDGTLLVMAKVAKNRGGRRGRIALSFDGRTQRWKTSSGNVSRRQGADL